MTRAPARRKLFVGILAAAIPYASFYVYFRMQSENVRPPAVRFSEDQLQTLETLNEILDAHAASAEGDLTRISSGRARIEEQVAWIAKNPSILGAVADPLLSWAELIENDAKDLESIQRVIIAEIRICRLAVNGLRVAVSRSTLLRTLEPFSASGPKTQDMLQQTELRIKQSSIGIGISPNRLPEGAYYEWNILSVISIDHQSRIAGQKKLHSDLVDFSATLRRLVDATPPEYSVLRFPF